MLVEVNRVLKTKDGKKTYYKGVLGKIMFNNDADVKIEAGNWVYCKSTFQTKRKALTGETPEADGLITLAPEDRKVVNIIQSSFPTMEKAVDAIVRAQAGDTAIIEAMKKVRDTFTVEDWKEMEAAV